MAQPHPAPTPGHAALPRWENVTLSQLQTGASILIRDTLFWFALASDDKCLKCGEQDGVEHLLLSARLTRRLAADAGARTRASKTCSAAEQNK